MADNPGMVITSDVLASIVAEAWPRSFTQLNIMSGFRKSGLFPLNPSMVDDRCIAPSKVFQPLIPVNPSPVNAKSLGTEEYNKESSDTESSDHSSCHSVELFTEQERLFEKRFEEGYDQRTHSLLHG